MSEEQITVYPLLENITKLVNSNFDPGKAIDEIMEALGKKFELSYIAIKEVTVDEHMVTCTYEWSVDGAQELLNCESRYLEEVPWNKWMHSYDNPEHVWTWDSSSGIPCPVRLIRTELAASILQIPLYRNGIFSGCVDFASSIQGREWKDNEVNELQQFGTILGSYLFRIRGMKNQDSDGLASLYDKTTKLPRYEYFCNEIEKNLSELDNCQLVICSFDFTNFKFINEKYGHSEGDAFLESIAHEIYALTKWVVTCCRSHSDNFLVLSKCNKLATKTRIRLTIEECVEEMVKKLQNKYFDCNLKVNAGIHIVKSDRENIEQAISNANLARKFAKQEKYIYGHSCLIYEPIMEFKLKQQTEYITTMASGLENDEFYIEFQPQIRTDTMEIIGAEALVRWKKQQVYRLLPEDFVPIFEKDGCILKLDYFVYECAFKYIYERFTAGLRVVPLSMNVSIVHFYDSEKLLDYIDSLHEKYPFPTKYIGFEMDEMIYVKRLDTMTDVIEKLHERGYKVFIDNFGSGYSSLNILTRFDIDGIKMDKSFMKNTMDRTEEIIISCVSDMAKKLKVDIMAEGVEREEQRNFLMSAGVTYIQGNYYSSSVTTDKFNIMIG